ncbi:hypothetical protein, conserved [Leishmania lindenbergi]|uniref:BRCT domain-containing protein n=1 Tax=Leishmania lindenbergi TaxID=651832 RepID=A0AAW3APV1_9TRYP
MYIFELSTASPCRSAPYYSLVIRKPYILGQDAAADINLAYEGISAEHVSMTVLNEKEAALEVESAIRATAGTEDGGDAAVNGALEEQDSGAAAECTEAEPATTECTEAELTTAECTEAEPATAEGIEAELTTAECTEAELTTAEGTEAEPATAECIEAEPATAEANGCKLVVRVTALLTKGDAEVRLGETSLRAGDSAIVRDGDVLYLGDGISGTFRYRPLVVGIEGGAYPEDYLNDLHRMFDQLGATLVDMPIPLHEMPATPIGQLYCTTELNDSTSCLAALSYGYSIVQPTYVFEWFAAVARNAAAPLSTLPAPSRFEVTVRCPTHPISTTYLRPESDTCPFSLFPIPLTAMTNRSRASLFDNRVLFFFTDTAATRYWRAVKDCGGAVYGPGDVEAAKEAVQALVVSQREAGMPSDCLPSNFYIIIDSASAAALLSSGIEVASPELHAFMEEVRAISGATHLPVMGEHSLFAALLGNKFCEEPVPLEAAPPTASGVGYNSVYCDLSDAFAVPPPTHQSEGDEEGVRAPRLGYFSSGGAPFRIRSASRVSESRASLPHCLTAVPQSWNQMRSFSHQRARSLSTRAPGQSNDGSFYAGSMTPNRLGRRRLTSFVVHGGLRSFVEDFDMLRVRIYSFLVREESKLDRAITIYHRNYFIDNDTMKYALGIKAQAADFMERVDDLLADSACRGAYKEALRCFWKDCSDMDIRAQHLLHYWDRSMPAAFLTRRIRSRRGSSIDSRRAASSRSMASRGAAPAANSPAPAAREEEPATLDANEGANEGANEDANEDANGSANEDANEDANCDAGDNQVAETFVYTQDPDSSEEAHGHDELYTTPEALEQLDAESHIQEHHITTEDVTAGMDRSDTVAASSATAMRAASPAYSPHRRTFTPSLRHSRGGTSASVRRPIPIQERPPWVSNWNEPQSGRKKKKRQKKSKQQQQQPELDKPASQTPAPTPAPRAVPRIHLAVVLPEYATDSPKVVRARSAGGGGSTHARRLPPLQLEGVRDTDEEGVRDTDEEGVRDTDGEGVRDTDGEGVSETSLELDLSNEVSEALTITDQAPVEALEAEEAEKEENQARCAPAPVPEPTPTKKTRVSKSRRAAAPIRNQRSNSAPVSKRTSSGGASRRPSGKRAVATNGNGFYKRDAPAGVVSNGKGSRQPRRPSPKRKC